MSLPLRKSDLRRHKLSSGLLDTSPKTDSPVGWNVIHMR